MDEMTRKLMGLVCGFAAAAELHHREEQEARDAHAHPAVVAYHKGKAEAWQTALKKLKEVLSPESHD